MNDKLILRKALRKAYGENFEESVYDDETRHTVSSTYIRGVVFEHSFAKALFGNGEVYIATINKYQVAWKYHLQQMVLEEYPIKYVEKFLKDEKD